MDGRRCKCGIIIIAVFVLGVMGCKNQQTTASGTPLPPQVQGNASSMIERALSPKPSLPQGPPPQQVEVAKAAGPLKPETVATFAELEVDAAFNLEELAPAERERRIEAARQKFQKALATDPKSLEAHRGLGRLYTRLGDRDKAMGSYQTALQHHPKNHALLHEAALSCGRFEDWTTALQLWQNAAAIDPDNRKYPRLMGLAMVRLGRLEEGFNVMLKVLPEAEARLVIAREMMHTGHADASRQQVELAVKADPSFAPAVNALTQMNSVQQTGFQQ
jgi:tetratricopeptide (TPR) repeat protein